MTFKRLRTIFVILLATNSFSLTAFAAPESTTTTEPETIQQRDYYLAEDLPSDLLAINRVLDDDFYGNESYFMTVVNLTTGEICYDETDRLSWGENNRLEIESEYQPSESIELSGGETLRVTIYYHNDNKSPTIPLIGSFFPDEIAQDTVKTIWAQVHLQDKTGSANAIEDRAYNVVPVIANSDVALEYVPDSLAWYGIDETLDDAIPLISDERMLPLFFQTDVVEDGLSLIVVDAPREAYRVAGFVSYDIMVSKVIIKEKSLTEQAKDKAENFLESDAFQSYNDTMTEAGKKLGDGLGNFLESDTFQNYNNFMTEKGKQLGDSFGNLIGKISEKFLN